MHERLVQKLRDLGYGLLSGEKEKGATPTLESSCRLTLLAAGLRGCKS